VYGGWATRRVADEEDVVVAAFERFAHGVRPAEPKRWLRELPCRDAEALASELLAGRLQGTTRGSVVELNVRERPAKLPAGERPYPHPFYWATFVLVGDPD
jgi:CHAT domain-containing protein